MRWQALRRLRKELKTLVTEKVGIYDQEKVQVVQYMDAPEETMPLWVVDDVLHHQAAVTVAMTQKRNPRRAAADAASSSSIRRFRRYLHDYQAATKKATVETQACGTWKKTIREDSPTKFWAGRA